MTELGEYVGSRPASGEWRQSVSYRVDVIIEKDQDGYYAYCPALEGCQSQGDTFEEAYRNIQEAAELYMETLSLAERASILGTTVIATSLELEVA